VELYNEGKTGEALPQFERAVAADPQLAKARYLLALCYVNAGQPARAKAELEAFLELAPDDPDAPAAREMLGYL
jgi:thioredoxin-like negative regulator of GroEL